MKGRTVPSRVTDEVVDAVSSLLNRRGVGARLFPDVRVCGRLEACHDGPPCPVLMPQCPSPGERWINHADPDRFVKAREALC